MTRREILIAAAAIGGWRGMGFAEVAQPKQILILRATRKSRH
jgi:hypothetical protein